MTQPRVLITAGFIFLTIFAAGAYYYMKLAREIDERLANGFLDNSAGIFTSPFKLSVGDRMQMDELAGYLRGAGYQQRDSKGNDELLGSFIINGDAIDVIPGRESRSQLGLVPARIKIAAGQVKSINALESNERLSSTTIEGELLAGMRNGDRHKRIAVAFTDIPENLRNAIIAIEDRRFFDHNGVDWHGVARALKADLNNGSIVQGGSTITQQLIKNAFLTSERTFSRKIKEAMMAVILESRLSKEEIFTHYANNVYLGQDGTFAIQGFAEAAQVYFGKTLDKLTLAESAFLAGLVHAPNHYALSKDMQRCVARRGQVLDAMVETGSITAEQADATKQEPIALKKRESNNDFGMTYFVDYAERCLRERFGDNAYVENKRVMTTIDPRLQRAAYEAISSHTAQLDKIFGRKETGKTVGSEEKKPVQAALVAIDAHTGEILSMIGGRDYDESQMNRATDAMRQPGSTFKPFVYAYALSSRSYTAASVLSDTPQKFVYDGGRAEYTPTNYHGGFSNRDVTLREALARSLNVPTVQLAMTVGLGNVATLAEECGLERPRAYPSMALGTSEVTPLELAGAYTAFANGGTALRPIPIKSTQGGDQYSLPQKMSATSAYVFSPQVAYLMTNLMQSVVDAGTASRLRAMGLKGAIAGKTGTDNDGWFVGYTPNIVCVVWVGFDDNRDLKMKASDVALPIWGDFMKEALAIHPEYGGDSFKIPGGIITEEIDPTTGMLAGPDCTDRRQEIFISGTEPYATCSHYESSDYLTDSAYDSYLAGDNSQSASRPQIEVEVCEASGLLASPTCARVVKKKFNTGEEPFRTCWGEGRDRYSERDSEKQRNEKLPSPPTVVSDMSRPRPKRY